MGRLEEIRLKEKQYHDHCYDNYILFEEGSWLHKPVQTIMKVLDDIADKEGLQVLDLGCGVGRNTIPLATVLKPYNGKVIGIDLLESAINHMSTNIEQYDVKDQIEGIVSDISQYKIELEAFDFIFAVSSLEHLDSMRTFHRVIKNIKEGTKKNGVNCFIINTNVSEFSIETGETFEPYYEIQFKTDELIELLNEHYLEWEVKESKVKPYQVEIEREEVAILLKGDVLTWMVKKI